jgi:TfoX/Sxy family transcriptional regulator of competence genes
MAIDENLVEWVRNALADAPVREVKMFGGLCFMLNGHMVVCASKGSLLVRVGEEGKAAAVVKGAQPMVMNGRQMKGFVVVEEGLNARAVGAWVKRARAFVDTLPASKR